MNLGNDLRYALRSLSHSPGFAAAAVVTVALGVGVNAGVFTVLNGMLFRELPAPDAHGLVSIHQSVDGVRYSSNLYGSVSTADYRTYRDQARTLSDVMAHSDATTAVLGAGGRRIDGVIVTCNYFDVLRQPPLHGRAPTVEDCAPGAAPTVVLGHSLWTTTFAADPGLVGRTVELNRQPFTVVGIAAEGTYGGSGRADYFAPVSTQPILRPYTASYEEDWLGWLLPIGRLRDGAGLEQARAELGVIAERIDQLAPGRSTTLTIDRAVPPIVPVFLRGIAMTAAAVLMTAFGLILLIACANVANLLLARGTARSQEIAIRLSLGASRGRVVRQLLTESLLIFAAGGLIGSFIALWSFQALVGFALSAAQPPGDTLWFTLDSSPDLRVISFALALTCVTGVVFGLAPALHASKPDLHSVIKQGTASAARGGRLRGTLVGVQVALSMTLMIAAGLLLRGLYTTYTIDPGFRYSDVAHVSILQLYDGRYSREQTADIQQRLIDGVRALPGVEAVAYASNPPLGGDSVFVDVRLPGESEDEARFSGLSYVTPDYFSALGIPIVRGRTFTDAESAVAGGEAEAAPVLVSETTARNLWPDGDPIGQTLLFGDDRLSVVGVAADVRQTTLGSVDAYYMYLTGARGEALLARSRTDFAAVASGIRGVMQALDPTLDSPVLPLDANLRWWRSLSGIVTSLGAGLGALALVLASIGIYGVVAYAVTRRYREIGIRMALGAEARNVLGTILRRTLRPVVIGVVVGIATAAASSSILSSVLFGVSPADPVGLGGAALVVVVVALAAAVLAARPATRADPTSVLRYE